MEQVPYPKLEKFPNWKNDIVFTISNVNCTLSERIDAEIQSYEKVSEYDQEMPQSHTADQPTAPWERDTEHRQPQRNKKVKQQLSRVHTGLKSTWI